MKYDITMLGHISRDIMIYGEEVQKFTGGPVIYSSAAAARSNKKVHVITRASAEDDPALDVIRKEGVQVTRLDSPATTSIKNLYLSADRERREATLLSRADSFSLADFPETDSRIYHLAGLFDDEIPDEFIPFLADKGEVGVDAQGLLRYSRGGKLDFHNWDAAEEMMPRITYFKVDALEAEIMTGLTDRIEAAARLASLGAREVILTHNHEVLVCTGGEVFRAPYNPSNLSGRTGRGDTTFASYMARRLDASPRESVWYAAALCSMKMEAPGPFKGTFEEVYRRMESMGYKD